VRRPAHPRIGLPIILPDHIAPSGPLRPRPSMHRPILEYVKRLVTRRTTHPVLSENGTAFIRVDLNSKRVLVWKPGMADQDSVVVMANFSDFVTANAGGPSAE